MGAQMIDLSIEMGLIRTGKKAQFVPPILIKANQLQLGVDTLIELGSLLSNLWLPPTFVVNYALQTNPAGLVFGVRINRPDAPILPWGIAGNNVCSFVGPVERIYVCLLSGISADVCLLGARGVGVNYSGALTTGGTPSSSPNVGGLGTIQS
jgi:hypothetical protein